MKNTSTYLSSAFSLITYPLVAIGLVACASSAGDKSNMSATEQRTARIAELQVVDCSLPGQTRMLGNTPYMTPRRPATLTAAECQTRGGEYVAYDRADLKTALAVWLPAAEQGDAEAQVNVGEIFEKGAGGSPNYQAAAIWYKKAADQGNKRGQFNIGTLYEQGLGVEKDQIAALDWYRQAWGLPKDDLVFQSSVTKQQTEITEALNKEIRSKNLQIKAMKNQIADLNASLVKANNSELKGQIQELNAIVSQLEQEAKTAQQKVTLYPRADQLVVRTPTAATQNGKVSGHVESIGNTSDVSLKNINFGKFYALVIGVQNYEKINSLETPINDINAIAETLTKRYNFNVTKVINADDVGVMEAINNINEKLTENDNLLIFYAGHGARLASGDVEAGYWLPTNAEAPPRDTYWVANEFVTRHLARFKAKRVLVVADSCYSGLLSSAPGFLMMGADGKYTDEYIAYKADKRSRLLLTSGGDNPVLDSVNTGHSIFTQAFLKALNSNNDIFSAPELFLQLKAEVSKSAKAVKFSQTPEYKTIKGAGHEVGDFFFIPTKS
ncbi:caspase family protein [Simiduia litorea]|uniref:caspase family protein n=1 Tax=Simiduia litorea TaxID=1435348 RepID=UPI0036F3A7A2